MFPKMVGFPPKSSIWIGFSIQNHPFWCTPSFGNSHTGLIIKGTIPKGFPTIFPERMEIQGHTYVFPKKFGPQ